MTRGCRQRIALFFRAQPRMFFLILLGPALSEKNCAAFCRDLREFWRGVPECDGRCVAVVGWFSGIGDVGCKARGLRGGWRSNPVRQGFRRHRAVTLTIEMHSVPIGRRRRMSTMSRHSADRARALTVRLHSVSSGAGAGMSTSAIGMRGAQAATLTVEIHSMASGFRRRISTLETARFVGPPFALTVRIHRVEDGFADRTSPSEHAGRAIAGSLSPLKYTGVRLAAVAVVHVRICVAARPYAYPHR